MLSPIPSSMSTILILAKLANGTGNKTTAERIGKYFLGVQEVANVLLCNISDFNTKDDFHNYAKRHNVKAIFGIHALRAGRLIDEIPVPYVLIFGGTDVHCENWSMQEMEIMKNVVQHAKSLVAFSNAMKINALTLWPFLSESDITEQPQGVVTDGSADYRCQDLFKEFHLDIQDLHRKKMFLFVGGIRPVKDPLFLLEVIEAWNKRDDSIMMVLIGPELDATFTAKCRERIKNSNCVYMFPEIAIGKIHSLLLQSTALVNTSLNEGMAGAILEAMHLGVPVLARRNPGNCALIDDGSNGFLFQMPQEFEEKATKIINETSVRELLTKNGQKFIKTFHSSESEKETYQCILDDLLTNDKQSTL